MIAYAYSVCYIDPNATLSTEAGANVLPTSIIDCYDDVRDIRFFPNFTSSDPDSCCFLVASRGTPVGSMRQSLTRP